MYLLVEVEVSLSPCRERQRRVVGLVALHTHRHEYRALCTQRHTTRAENLFEWPERKIHVENIERLLLLIGDKLHIAVAVVLLHRAAEHPVIVLLSREHEWRTDFGITDFGAYHIAARGGVVVSDCGDVRRRCEVVRKLVMHKVFVTPGHRGGNRKRQRH